MVYFTLFHLDPLKLISFDRYLPIASNTHWWIVKWWLWLHTYSLTSKWFDRASLFTIPSNDWWKVLIQLERSTKHRKGYNKYSLIKKDINFWKEDLQPESRERGLKLWNDCWNSMWLNSRFQRAFWMMLRSDHKYSWIHRQKVAKTIQVQRLWKEARRPWLRFAKWANT